MTLSVVRDKEPVGEICKMLHSHAFERFHPVLPRPEFGWRLSLRCMRNCGTERHDLIDARTGEKIGRRYIYAEGYRNTRSDPRPTSAEFRQAMYARLRHELIRDQAVAAEVMAAITDNGSTRRSHDDDHTQQRSSRAVRSRAARSATTSGVG